ncbi:hypothetical protein [Eubacterium sp. 1001713B170207_170306_E7]|uniref:hypothetical protein n=1 Tax=Eubacterium sp. 1001713B170207_170306_E7 TaxID=2787097 RepID=UPI00189BDB35|nr:hypothetical protein [Eubacterium sp. 1001713B170207_170306_E7]
MTLQALEVLLKTTGMPVAYHHWEVGEVPPLPYLIYYEDSSDSFYADNRVYQQVIGVTVELYTDRKDPAIEEKLETVMDHNDIAYTTYESYLESEQMYLHGYEFEILKRSE